MPLTIDDVVVQAVDPVTAAINRLPGIVQEDVHRLLALRNDALARAHEPAVFNDDESVIAVSAVVRAYAAALRTISEEFHEPYLDLGRRARELDQDARHAHGLELVNE